MLFFNRTCKEVATLLIAREDRALPWTERIALRMHLAACAACPRFERQMLTLRNAMHQWRHYTEDTSEPGGGAASAPTARPPAS